MLSDTYFSLEVELFKVKIGFQIQIVMDLFFNLAVEFRLDL
jgi:hypothetical protein